MNIELKKWTNDYIDDLVRISNEVDRTYLSNSLPFPYKEKDAVWWIKLVNENEGSRGVYRSISVDGKIVGNITLEKKQDAYLKDSELGYMIVPYENSKGIMTEALRQMCELAFKELDILQITGLVYGGNIASQRVLEKNGFALSCVKKNAVLKDSKALDVEYYVKTKKTTLE